MTVPLLLTLAALSSATAADLSQVRPKRLAEAAVVSVSGDGGRVALVTPEGVVWAGTRRLEVVGELAGPPNGLHMSGGAITAWSTRRAGLCVETTVATFGPDGAASSRVAPGGPRLVMPIPGGHALLWADHVERIPAQGGEPQVFPLPPGRAVGLSMANGRLQVDGADGALMRIDLEAGCPTDLPDDDPAMTALARKQLRDARRVCGAPPHLPDRIDAIADVARAARLAEAVRAGDTDALARLGAPTCAQLEALRPVDVDAASAFSTRFDRTLTVAARAQPQRGLGAIVRVSDPGIDLGPWMEGPYAPACAGTLVFWAEEPAIAGYLRQRLTELRTRGGGCADQARVAWPSDVGPFEKEDEDDPGEAFYVQPGGGWVGVRRGALSPRMVRLDLARLDPSDPLHGVAKAPELVPSWTVGPGPGGDLVLDVDRSWVAGAGWDLVRGPPNAIRKERASLLGPVERVQGRADGRFEVVSGGQPARVTLEDGGSVAWTDALSPPGELLPVPDALPPKPAVDPGPFRVVGEGRLAARSEAGTVTVTLGLPVQRVLNGRNATAVVTPLGIVGVGRDGTLLWRMTEARQWVFTGDFVVGTSPWGVHGYRLPY